MDTGRIADILDAAGHVTRLGVLKMLATEADGLPAGELARRLSVVQNTLSPHLKRLADAELVEVRRSGTTSNYSLNRGAMRSLSDFFGEL